ncbi:tetratricopeptide repeat protein [Lentzea sp. NPDC004789]
MIERVRREDTWHREARNCYPDPYRIMRVQFPIVEELRDTPRETWPQRDALPTALHFLAETFEDCGWDDLALRVQHELLELHREAGDLPQVLRVLSSIRANLVRQELFEDALRFARAERSLAVQLAAAGGYHVVTANDARYWVSHVLDKLGRYEEAARNTAEAVAERRGQKPVKDGPPEGYPLAHALLEYARRLAKIGQHEQAIEHAAEAAAFWRRRPDAATTSYNVLDELSLLQLRAGRFDDARASHAEAVAIFREGAKRTGRWELRNHLAGALHNHGNRLHDLGLDEEALAPAEEAADRYRALAAEAERPELRTKMEVRLALALVSLSDRLHDTGRLDESLAASDEAIALASRYPGDDLARHELARAWGNRASVLISRGDHREAVAAARKGLDLYETPQDKARARNTFAVASAQLGDLGVALEASLRAVAEYREWYAENPSGYAYLLADALTDHARIRLLRGERAEAEPAITESIALHEELVAVNPGRYRRELDHARAVAAQIE